MAALLGLCAIGVAAPARLKSLRGEHTFHFHPMARPARLQAPCRAHIRREFHDAFKIEAVLRRMGGTLCGVSALPGFVPPFGTPGGKDFRGRRHGDESARFALRSDDDF